MHKKEEILHKSIGNLFNPLDAAYLTNPYTFLARARHEEPIFFSPGLNIWVISRYVDIMNIVKDPKRFSSAYLHRLMSFTPEALAILMTGTPDVRFPLTTDPP